MKRIFLSLLLLIATLWMEAKSNDGLFVTTGSERVQFPTDDVKEVLFSDDKLTIMKTDGAVVSFATSDGWKIEFGQMEATGITTILSTDGAEVEVYDASGMRVQNTAQGGMPQMDRLPKGTYIVKVNGKNIKISK